MSETLNQLKNREDTWNSNILSHLILMNRTNRPDEWEMDELARMALSIENSYSEAMRERNDAVQASLIDITRADKAEADLKKLDSDFQWLLTVTLLSLRQGSTRNRVLAMAEKYEEKGDEN